MKWFIKNGLWILFALTLVVGGVWAALLDHYNKSKALQWEEKKAQLAVRGIRLDTEYIFKRRVSAEKNIWEAPITGALLFKRSGTSVEARALAPLISGQVRVTSERRFGVDNKPGARITKPTGFPESGTFEEKVESWSAPMLPALSSWLAEARGAPEAQIIRPNVGPLYRSKLSELSTSMAALSNLHAIGMVKARFTQPETAAEASYMLLYLSRAFSCQGHPVHANLQMVAIGYAIDVIYQGMKSGIWTEPQLRDFDTLLAKADLFESVQVGRQGELLLHVENIEALKNIGISDFGDWSPKLDKWVLGLSPYGSFDQAKVDFAEIYEDYFFDPNQPQTAKVETAQIGSVEDMLKDPRFQNTGLTGRLLRIMFDTTTRTEFNAYNVDMDIKLTRIAIALERYKLKYQKYPDELSALVPEFLAVISVDFAYQKAPSYEQTPSGRYRMWHPGWDGKDEGGMPAKRLNEKYGDLLWTFEPVTPMP